jgi:hypothetical protein
MIKQGYDIMVWKWNAKIANGQLEQGSTDIQNCMGHLKILGLGKVA